MRSVNTGGRPASIESLAARRFAIEQERAVSRKELAQIERDAEKALKLATGPRLVLRELVGCWGENPIQGRLLVWPSNEYLVNRSGLSERTVRYALRKLATLKLIVPKDSANGKRYRLSDLAGTPVDAFGFDLTPLYARRGEWTTLLAEQKRERDALMRDYDEITVCRRAAREALTALATSYPDADRTEVEMSFDMAQRFTPRRGSALPPEIISMWKSVRQLAEEAFYNAGNGGNSSRHKEDNNGSPSESCSKGFRKEAEPVRQDERTDELPLWMVLEACPTLADYGRPICDIEGLIEAARYLRPTLGASQDAWSEAVDLLGIARAAAVLIFVLQLFDDDVGSGAGRIKNPGGYFRAMARKVAERGIDLKSEFLALRRRHMT